MSRVFRCCSILLLIAAGVAQAAEPVVVQTADDLKANIGKRVTCRGVWSDRGKLGSFVKMSTKQTVEIRGPIDQENRLFGLWDEHRVRIIGTLRHFEIPAKARAELVAGVKTAVAMPPDHYYITVDDLRVEDEAHPELGLQWARHQPTRGDNPIMLYETWRPVNAEPRAVNAADFTLCRVPPLGFNPHTDGFVSVYVNPLGRDGYLAGRKQLPRGTVIVKEKRLAKTGGKAEELGVMIKRDEGFDPTGGDWEFLFVDRAGKVSYKPAETLNCRMCHAMRNSHDFVFRAGLAKSAK